MLLLWLIGRDQVATAQIVADQEMLAQSAFGGVGITPGERQEDLAVRIDQVRGDGGFAEGVAPALDVALHQERRDRLVDLHHPSPAPRPPHARPETLTRPPPP